MKHQLYIIIILATVFICLTSVTAEYSGEFGESGNSGASGGIEFEKLTNEELVEYMRSKNPYYRTEAAKAIGKRGGKAIPHLTMLLKDESIAVRRSATDAFAVMKKDMEPAIEALAIAAIEDDDIWVRAGASDALGKSGIKNRAIDETLAEASGDKHTWVREAAMRGLFERSRQKLIEDKELLLSAAMKSASGNDINYNVWRYAVPIIKQNGGAEDPNVIPVMTHLLSIAPHGMWGVGVIKDAAGILAAHGSKSSEATTVLIKAAQKFGLPVLRICLVDTLAAIGPAAKKAIPDLEQLLKDEKNEEAIAAITKAINSIQK